MENESTSNGINNLSWCKIKQRIIRYIQQEEDAFTHTHTFTNNYFSKSKCMIFMFYRIINPCFRKLDFSISLHKKEKKVNIYFNS